MVVKTGVGVFSAEAALNGIQQLLSGSTAEIDRSAARIVRGPHRVRPRYVEMRLLAVAFGACAVLIAWQRWWRSLYAHKLLATGTKKRWAAFVSHFKAEAAMEARYIHEALEGRIGPTFIDSDDLVNLTQLTQNVRDSGVLVLVQSKGVLERPWCILEIMTAIEHGIPIIGISLTSGPFAYDFAATAAYLDALDTELEERNPGTSALLVDHGVQPSDAARKLSATLPKMISTPFNPSASKNVLHSTLEDVVEQIRKAKPLEVSAEAEESFHRRRSRSRTPGGVTGLPHGSSAHHRAPPFPVPPKRAKSLSALPTQAQDPQKD